MDTIAKRMKALREAAGLGVTEAAGKLDIKQPSLTAIEKGRTLSLKGDTLVHACEVYKTTPTFILYGAGHVTDEESAMLEAQLVHTFRSASPEIRRSIVGAARGLVEQDTGPAVYKKTIGDTLTKVKHEVKANVPVTLAAKETKRIGNPKAAEDEAASRSPTSSSNKGDQGWSKKS